MELQMQPPAESPQVLALTGDWDLSRRDELHRAFESVASAPRLVIDLSQAYFMDSTALSEVVRLNKRREAQHLTPARFVVNALIQRIFDVVNFTALYEIYQTVEDALADAEASPSEN